MTCAACGASNRDDASFCGTCGTPLERTVACSRCGRDNPEAARFCDSCGGELYRREDDAAPVVRERLRVYREKTAPLVRYYQERGLLESIDGEQAPDVVFARLAGLIPEGG